MQRRRNEAAADKFFHKLLKPQQCPPGGLITDKLKSYGAAKKKILKGVDHRQHKDLNNRAENFHRPTRVREGRMGRFKYPVSAFDPIRVHVQPFQHQLPAPEFREIMSQRFESWRDFTGMNAAA